MELQALEDARARCDWPAVIARAQAVRNLAPHGSDAWFEACGHEVLARSELWQPAEIEQVAREALAALAEVRRGLPDARRSAGPLHARCAGHVARLEVILARVMQSRGLHAEALGHLRLVIEDLRVGPALGGVGLLPEAALDAARSLILLGREADARAALTSLRDNFRGSREAASASVLLQLRDGPSAYRGKYQGDAEHLGRMQALLELVPRARERAATRLGLSEADLAEIPVGFVDLPSDMRQLGALAEGDPRRPGIPAVVLVFNEVLALDMVDMETVLVHELTHALLMAVCGPAYYALPLWMAEGLSDAVAEQTDANMDMWLANRLSIDPVGFASEDYWKKNELVFDAGPCAPAPTQEAGFAIMPLVEQQGIDGVRQLVGHIRAGRSAEEALQAVLGLGVGEYLALAQERVQAELEARRQRVLAAAHALARARAGGPAAVLARAEQVIRDEPPPLIVGFALWQRADALVKLGRFEEALAAARELLDARRAHPSYVELALMDQARALSALGRRDEARSALRKLERDAMTREAARWASEQMAQSQ